MRKFSFYLMLVFITSSCDSKEELTIKSQALNNPMQLYIINGDIEYYSEITDGSKPKAPILVYDIPDKTEEANNLTSKTSEQSVTMNFNYGIAGSTKSGCTITRYMQSGKTYETDAGVYGPNPAPQNDGYLIRGYGVPHQNPSYGALALFVGNRGFKTQDRRGVLHDNQQNGSAISIAYPFKPNITYEISITATFRDGRYLIDKVYSSGYPTMFVQLKNDGIITARSYRTQTEDPCDREGIVSIDEYANDYPNYTRSYTLDNQGEYVKKILVFKFSPIQEKKALLISLRPTIGRAGYEAPIPTNSHIVIIPSINITEKPFDQSLNIEIPENQRNRN